MFSRRKLLRQSSAFAAPLLLGEATRANGAGQAAAISGLPHLAGQAQPFTIAEREERIEKARKLMMTAGVQAILFGGGASSHYFANISGSGGERLWALVLPVHAKPFLVCPAFEEDRAREMLENSPLKNSGDILTWQEDEDPFRLLILGLKERGVATGHIGLDENLRFVFTDSLMRAKLPAMEMVSAVPITAGCRMIKDEHEMACLRLAAKATLLVYEAAFKSMHEGMTQKDLEDLVQAGYQKVGFMGEVSVNLDRYTAVPHGSEKPQTIRDGSIVMLDDGCRVEGYWSDITRTFVLGQPTEKMKQVFDIVHRAQDAALKAARPGIANEAVDAAARRVIIDAGYGPGFKYFTHRVGHGLGLEMHEWNYLVRNNMYGWTKNPVLEPGMVFSDEPGIYIKGEFGIRLEDDMHITADGAELLTPQSAAIDRPFA